MYLCALCVCIYILIDFINIKSHMIKFTTLKIQPNGF